MAQSPNYIEYPTMARQREDSIQSGMLAKAEDVNVEFNSIIDTYNRLISLLQGEWGGDTGRIYELVDEAIKAATEAKAAVAKAVLKAGDTMEGQLNQPNLPVAADNVVNKRYVDGEIANQLSQPKNDITNLKDRLDNLNATQVKLDNGNFTGKTVDAGMTELFTSVSSGKEMLAAAITDKSGIDTAANASFKTMTDNIMAIVTFNEGTSGGTATAGDIIKGKTAYARNQFITGTLEILNTSDATVTPDKIVAGYSAYAKGQKIYGTLIPYDWGGGNVTNPTYGTDTSDATATSSDILYGKTAYARGAKLYGTLKNADVEEINPLSTEDYKVNRVDGYGVVAEADANFKRYKIMKGPFSVSPDGTFIVSSVWTYEKKTEGDPIVDPDHDTLTGKFIESNKMDDTRVYISATQNGSRKYRYSYDELFLDPDKDISNISLGNPGFHGNNDLGLLCITQGNTVHYYLYDYSSDSYGLIGANPRFPNEKTGHWKVVFPNEVVGAPAFANENVGVSAVVTMANRGDLFNEVAYLTFVRIMDNWSTEVEVDVSATEELYRNKAYDYEPHTLKFSNNDNYFYFTSASKYKNPQLISGDFAICRVNKSQSFAYSKKGNVYSNSINTAVILSADETKIFFETKVSTLTYNEGTGDIEINDLKTDLFDPPTTRNLRYTFSGISPDNRFYFIAGPDTEPLRVYEINIETGEKKPVLQEMNCDTNFGVIFSKDYSFATMSGYSAGANRLYRIRKGFDTSTVIGVKYKGEYFYKQDITKLTAVPADVRKDKTYIGATGVLETGTAEF